MGDWSGFMDKVQDVVPMDQQPELLENLLEGNFTLNIIYQQYQNMLKLSSINQVFSMIPGFSDKVMPKGSEKESQAKLKRYVSMMDSMTKEELDSLNPKLTNDSRIARVARGSGCQVRDVMEMLEEHERAANVMKKFKGAGALSRSMNTQHMGRVLPPQMLQQVGGMAGLQSLMKQIAPGRR